MHRKTGIRADRVEAGMIVCHPLNRGVPANQLTRSRDTSPVRRIRGCDRLYTFRLSPASKLRFSSQRLDLRRLAEPITGHNIPFWQVRAPQRCSEDAGSVGRERDFHGALKKRPKNSTP